MRRTFLYIFIHFFQVQIALPSFNVKLQYANNVDFFSLSSSYSIYVVYNMLYDAERDFISNFLTTMKSCVIYWNNCRWLFAFIPIVVDILHNYRRRRQQRLCRSKQGHDRNVSRSRWEWHGKTFKIYKIKKTWLELSCDDDDDTWEMNNIWIGISEAELT